MLKATIGVACAAAINFTAAHATALDPAALSPSTQLTTPVSIGAVTPPPQVTWRANPNVKFDDTAGTALGTITITNPNPLASTCVKTSNEYTDTKHAYLLKSADGSNIVAGFHDGAAGRQFGLTAEYDSASCTGSGSSSLVLEKATNAPIAPGNYTGTLSLANYMP